MTTRRLSRCRGLLTDLGLDGVIVTQAADVRYLSGFRGDDTALLVGQRCALICTDSRYWPQVREEVTEFALEKTDELLPDVVEAAARELGANAALGFQGSVLTYADHRAVRRLHGGRLKNVGDRVSRLREVKEAAEVEAIARAAALVDEALAVVVAEGLVGRREDEVAWRLADDIHARGAEGESFPTIVAAGQRGAQGHAIPGPRQIAAGELVVIDTGARVDGYCSDITRTFAAGRVSGELRRVYDVVRAAQAAALAAVRPGANGRRVDATARAVIEEAGYGEQFGHGTGHGVGLQVHELPRLGRRRGDRLATGMVCTVEPGIYLEGVAGVRIEDTVVVTEDGCRLLTRYPKELQVVD